MTKTRERIEFIILMMLFGTIGTISRFINMPTSIICLGRAIIGALVILVYLKLTNKKINFDAIKKDALWIVVGALMLSLDWIFQFEAFKHTTIATGTLCYYTEPVFYIVASMIVFKEKVKAQKWFCVAVAFLGMIFVSGVIQTGFDWSELKGVIYGIFGGFFYAMVVVVNRFIKNISPIETTLTQMSLIPIILIPYILITGEGSEINFTGIGIVCLVALGIIHTGFAYAVYYGLVKKLPAQTVGILSYIDPATAVFLSALFLKEELTIWTIIGALLILGATAVSEFTENVVK